MFLVAVEDGVIVGSVMAGYQGHRGSGSRPRWAGVWLEAVHPF
jgi:hypothetical protein